MEAITKRLMQCARRWRESNARRKQSSKDLQSQGSRFRLEPLESRILLSTTPIAVTQIAADASGFTAQFNQAVDATVLSLYDVEAGTLGPADVTLVGATQGAVKGSLVVNGDELTFIKTGGPLTPDDYTVTLRSAANGIKGIDGSLLDGNRDGTGGDNFVYAFAINPVASRTVGIADFARGPGQTIQVPAPANGIPISISDGSGVTSVDLTLRFDPQLLKIIGIVPGAALPAGTTVLPDLSVAGVLTLHISAVTPMSAGPLELVRLISEVPHTAPYGATGALNISDLSINNGSVASIADDGIQAAAYFGEATGNRSYSALDGSRILRVVVGLDSGFAAYPFIDPVLLTDITGNSILSALDGTRILQEIVGLDRPEIEAITAVILQQLLHDTGSNSTDRVTADPAITGTVRDDGSIASFKARVDLASSIDVTADLVNGSFSFNRARLEQIAGGPLTDGVHTLSLQAVDNGGNISTVSSFSFTLDATLPGITEFSLSAGSDTGTPGDNITAASQIMLTGTSEAGALLMLNGTQVLAGAGGKFQVPDVDLVAGPNLFTLTATDPAGNIAQQTLSINRQGVITTDVSLQWNQQTLEAIRLTVMDPPIATRVLAMVSLAQYDTLAAIDGTPAYLFHQNFTGPVSVDLALAKAAHTVLYALFPSLRPMFDAALNTLMGTIADGVAKTNALALGLSVGIGILAIRGNDGSDEFVDYPGSEELGSWRPTAPMFEVAEEPQWGDVTPFALTSPEEFRASAPPALDSAAYAQSVEEIRSLGGATSATRTADQTQSAQFWADGKGSYTPAGHWNQIAQQIALSQGNSLSSNVRLMAQLNVALADAAIAAWDTKYTFSLWRPIDAIHEADLDGNAATIEDDSWTPLLITPFHPEYVSGHSTFSAAAAGILGAEFGDNTAFSTTAFTLPGITRNFTSFTQAAQEAGRSRVYGGIHYEFTNQAGQSMGQQVAAAVLARFALNQDIQAPAVIADPTPAATKTNVTLTGQILDNISGVAQTQFKIDSGAFQNLAVDGLGHFSITTAFVLNGTADGTHTIAIQTKDAANNSAAIFTRSFELDTRLPLIALGSILDNAAIDISTRLTGAADPTGSKLAVLNYKFDNGTPRSMIFDSDTGSFDESIAFGNLGIGSHTLTLTAKDAAGNQATLIRTVTIASATPLTVTKVTPEDGSGDVGSTFRPQVFFSKSIHSADLNSNNFFATDSAGNKLAATIVPAQDGSFAWLFFVNPMSGGETITVHVDGSTIHSQDGTQLLDADGNGTGGGLLQYHFTTVSLIPVPGTTLTGRVFDPGPDLEPMTFDDIRRGPDGIIHTADDVFLNPIVGAKVFILGRESEFVLTDAQGRFTLTNVPAGNVKLAIDGRTATNAPAGIFFPEMVMDVAIESGLSNTVMGSMGTAEEQRVNETRDEVYLPRLAQSILQTVSNSQNTIVGVDAASSPNLTDEERAQLKLVVQPGSLVDANGNPVVGGQVGISTVPPELVRDMLPPGVLQHTFDITIQAPGVAAFNTPLQITFPNTFNAAPGEKLNFLSFDHTTGRLVIEGTATVSEDGLSVTTDPGQGITKPGWHGLIGRAITAIEDFFSLAAKDLEKFLNNPDLQALSRLMSNIGGVIDAVKDFAGAVKAALPIVLGAFGAFVGGPIGAGVAYEAGLVTTAIGDLIVNQTAALWQGMLMIKDNLPVYEKIYEKLGFEWAWGQLSADWEPIRQQMDQNGRDAILQATPVLGTIINLKDALSKWPEIKEDFKTLWQDLAPSAEATQLRDSANQFYASSRLNGAVPPVNQLAPSPDDGLQQIVQIIGAAPPTPQISSAFADIVDITSDADSGLLPADRDLFFVSRSISEVERIVSQGTGSPQDFAGLSSHLNFLLGNMGAVTDYAARRDADLRTLSSLQSQAINLVVQNMGLVGTAPSQNTPVYVDYSAGGPQILIKALSPSTLPVSLPLNSLIPVFAYDPIRNLFGESSIATGQVGGTTIKPQLILLPATGNDSDGDGIPDTAERALGTSPFRADSDGDGISDRAEILAGTDPLGGRGLPTGVVGSVSLQGESKGIVVEGSTNSSDSQTAYVATGSYGLAIVNASQFRTPIVLGQLDLPGDSVDVSVDAQLGIAAVASGAGGLNIVNVANPNAPVLMRTIALNTTQVEVIEGIAYVSVGTGLRAYDLLTGEFVEILDLGAATIVALARDGQTLYTVDANRTMRAVDRSSGAMVARGTILLPTAPSKLFVAGGVAYVGTEVGFLGGFETVNVADADNLTLLSGVDSTSIAAKTIALNGSGLAVTVGSPGALGNLLQVINVSNPTVTNALVTQVTLLADPFDVAIGAGIAFVADGTGDLQVVNYLPADSQGVAPTVSATLATADIDPNTPGVQLLEGSLVNLGVVISDDVQVRNAELLVNGVVVSNDVRYPFDLSAILPSIAANGSDLVTLQARATDTGGNFGLSAPISVHLVPDVFGPVLTRSNVTEGGVFGRSFRTVLLTFSEAIDAGAFSSTAVQLIDGASNAVSAQNIQFQVGGKQVQLTFPTLVVGNYTLRIDKTQVRDSIGNAMGSGVLDTHFTVKQFSVEWISASGGNWNTAANWSTGIVPVVTDDVFIGATSSPVIISSGTVTVQSLITNTAFTLSGGTLVLNGDSEINGAFTMSNATLSGPGKLILAGTHTLISGSMIGTGQTILQGNGAINSMNLDDDRILQIQGTTTWTGSASQRIYFNIGGGGGAGNGGTISVAASGVFDIQTDALMANWTGSVGQFNNAGIVRKTVGAGTTGMDMAMNNSGTVSVQTGTLRFAGGGTDTGSFGTVGAAVVQFGTGVHNLLASSSVTGNVLFTGFQQNGVQDVTTIGGSFAATNTTIGSAADVVFNSTGTSGTLTMTGVGRLRGSGTLTVTGTHTLTSAAMSGTGQTILQGNGTVGSLNIDDDRVLQIQGTTVWSGPASQRIYFNLGGGGAAGNGGTISVTATGIFDIQTDALMDYWSGAAGQFNNAGIVRKTIGAGTTGMDMTFNNSGIVSVQTGTLRFGGGGTDTGSFGTVGAGIVQFGTGVHNLLASSSVTGNVLFTGFQQNGVQDVTTIGGSYAATNTTIGSSADVAFNSTGTSGTLTMTGVGRLRGSGTLTVTGTHTLTSAAMSGTGQTILMGNGTVSSLNMDDDRVLQIQGTTAWTGSAAQRIYFNVGGSGAAGNGGTIAVTATGIFDIQTDALMDIWTGSVGQFNNAGIVRKTLGSGTTGMDMFFNNTGLVDAQTGILRFGGGGTDTGTFNAATATSIQFNAGTHNFNGGSATGAGTLSITGATVNVNGAFTATNFSMTAGSLSGTGILTVTGTHTLTAGNMIGTGQTILQGNGTINSMSMDDDRVLQIQGTTVWTGPATQRIYFNVGGGGVAGNGGTINVTATGIFDIQTDALMDYWSGAAGQFNNAGIVRKTVGAGATGMDVLFNNSGTASVQTGTLRFGGGGTQTGSFGTTGTGVVQFGTGIHNLLAASSVTGNVMFTGFQQNGTLDVTTVGGTYAAANTTVGSVADVVFNSTGSTGTLTMTGSGRLRGSGTLTVSGTHTLTSGIMAGTGQTILQGNGTVGSLEMDDDRVLQIQGTTAWTGAASQRIYFNLGGVAAGGNGGTISVTASGIFDIQTDALMTYWTGTAGQFNNAGIVRKTIGAGITGIDVQLNNAGTVDTQVGTIRFGGGGTDTGTFNAAATAAIQFNAGTVNFNGGSGTGAGTMTLAGANLNVNVAYAVTNFSMSSGILGGAGALSISGTHTLTAGSMTGTGQTILLANGTISSMNLDDDRVLQIQGTTTWTGNAAQRIYFNVGGGGAAGNGGTINVTATGIFDIQTDALMTYWTGTAGQFNNAGIVRKTVATGITGIDVLFNSTGSVDVQTGTLRFGGGGTQTGTYTIQSGASLQFNAGTNNINGGSISGAGSLLLNGATMNFNSAYSLTSVNLSAGAIAGAATLTITGTGSQWTGGAMTGGGTTKIAVGADLTISGTGIKTLGSRTIQNDGTLTDSSTGGRVELDGTAILNNTGLFDIRNSTTITSWDHTTNPVGTLTINNSGTLKKSIGTADFLFNDTTLNNTGTIQILAGRILVNGIAQ